MIKRESAESEQHSRHKDDKKEHLRHCIVTRQKKPRDDMIRFVLSPDHIVTPDLKEKLPGRGVWLTAKKELLTEAIKKGHFNRGFQERSEPPEQLEDLVETLLKQAALGRLKLANKSGEMVMGATKLMAALEKGSIIALIHASGASPEETRKLDHRLRTNVEQMGKLGSINSKNIFNCFKTEELSLAFGAANVIHAGLKTGGAGLAAIKAMQKLVSYQG